MSHAARVVVAVAALAAGCSSLQVAPGGSRVCEAGMIAYEAVQGSLGICSVFCLPEGECELGAQTGKLSGWGITSQGNCQDKGFTVDAELGNISLKAAQRLKWVQGPCRGMTLAKKFQKPEGPDAPPKAPASARVCGYEQVAYEAINVAFPGTCSVFCVPEGQCHAQAMAGGLAYLGLTGQGNCKHAGYTEAARPGNVTEATRAYLRALQGPCSGMTFKRFQMPPAGDAGGPLCKPSQTAYEAVTKQNPGMCSVYCIPAGDCEGQVQSGSMSHLGVLGPGSCGGRGFTERMQYTTPWAKYVQGPCKGLEAVNFQRPALMEEKGAPVQGSWGN